MNKCRQTDFDRHIESSRAIWRKRSSKRWRIDWGEFEAAIAEAKAARECWAARNPNYQAPDNDFDVLGPGHHMPTVCPACQSKNSLQLIEEDTDQMTEGQEADYEAGIRGAALCRQCGSDVEW